MKGQSKFERQLLMAVRFAGYALSSLFLLIFLICGIRTAMSAPENVRIGIIVMCVGIVTIAAAVLVKLIKKGLAEKQRHKTMDNFCVATEKIELPLKNILSDTTTHDMTTLHFSASSYYDRFTCADNRADEYAKSFLQMALNSGEDLIAIDDSSSGCCCSECAKYVGRVYSISGKSVTFPKLPEYFRLHGNFHHGCTCTASVYYKEMGGVLYKGKSVDPVQASNRPWVDDRTPNEIKRYEEHQKRMQEGRETEKQHRILDYLKSYNEEEFELIQCKMPDISPKTLSGYSRIKQKNTASFQKIKKRANDIGLILKDPPDISKIR